jgi:hypothetical protein
MHLIEQITDLDVEIDLLTASLQATCSPDARRWIAACLNVCLREHAKLTEQHRSAAIMLVSEPLRERSLGEAA